MTFAICLSKSISPVYAAIGNRKSIVAIAYFRLSRQLEAEAEGIRLCTRTCVHDLECIAFLVIRKLILRPSKVKEMIFFCEKELEIACSYAALMSDILILQECIFYRFTIIFQNKYGRVSFSSIIFISIFLV